MAEHTGNTPPGWYHAPGDPVGTHRYWDGAAWRGEPQAVQAFQAAPAGTAPIASSPIASSPVVADDGWPGWLTVVVWIVTVLKAIPLVGSLFVGLLVLTLSVQIDEELGDLVGAVAGIMLAFVVAVVVIGGILLFVQQRAASKRDAGTLFVMALVLSLLDALIVAGSWRDRPILVVIVLVLQLTVTVGAYQARVRPAGPAAPNG